VEPAPAFADQPPALHREVVVGDLARRHSVSAELRDRRDVAVIGVEVDEKQAEAVEASAGVVGVGVVGAGEQQTHL
jgi:hypothetical protein